MRMSEPTLHVGHAPSEENLAGQTNHRNGSTSKTELTTIDALPLEIPHGRDWSLRPQLVPFALRRLPSSTHSRPRNRRAA
jgi:transposase-like protein